ncbi:MAG TPA: carboxypeptidase-like regulatory domain-containing protein [Bryobacteraceae bacterium]|nr:carboxypeptidase-like regulatory domain-containing protein [Bryobacteraceae bacterium]
MLGTKLFRACEAALLIIGLLALSAPATLEAQTTGTISGFVTDPSGAAIPEAKITATLVEQDVSRSTKSNEEGYYIFNAMPPGTYRLEAEQSGFQRLVHSEIQLTVSQNLRVDLGMRLGRVSETVEVTASALLVDTLSPALSSLVDDRRVVDLPLNGRNVISLASTLPGVLGVLAPQQLTDARSGPLMNVNGGIATQNLFTFNGGIFVNPSRNTGLIYPPPDALQELSIQTQNFTAEYGRNAGSQVNVVSKSGTNEIHGALWEFLRNDNLNARNFFASRVPGKIQNQFGFAAGGPIRRNKLFIFGSYQALRYRAEALGVSLNVPSDAVRAGDFRELSTTLKNPVDTLTG